MGKVSGYQVMWAWVLFDLPVGTKKQRRRATRFRNYLLDEGFAMRRFTQHPTKGQHSKRSTAGSMVSLSKYHGNGNLNASVGGAPGAGSGTFGSMDRLDAGQVKVLNHLQGVSTVN